MIVENTATQRVHTTSCCTSIWPRFRIHGATWISGKSGRDI